MRFPDSYTIRRQTPRETIVFGAAQLSASESVPSNYFLNFNDECFVLADGVSMLPHGGEAAKLACETALWGYKHIRQHPYYWLDKKLFMKRIFRSTNLAVWQKRREKGFEEGLATSLLVLMVSAKNYWLGLVGNTSAWLYRNGKIAKLTQEDVNPQGELVRAVGFQRLGLIPHFLTGSFEGDDSVLLVTSGVADFLTTQDMMTCFCSSGTESAQIVTSMGEVLEQAKMHGSKENMTAMLIKRMK